MILYYPLSAKTDLEYDCSGGETLNNGVRIGFPTGGPFDSLSTNRDKTSVPVASYYTFTGSSRINLEDPIIIPEDFTISFWVRKTNTSTRNEYIFKSSGQVLSIFIDTSSDLNVVYSSTITRKIPIQIGKWTLVVIRKGNVEISKQSTTETKDVLFIETTTVSGAGNFEPFSTVLSSSFGGSGMPEITRLNDDIKIELNTSMALPSTVSFSTLPTSTYSMLESFSGNLSEFRIWNKILTTEELNNLARTAFIIKNVGSGEDVEMEFMAEDIREVENNTGYNRNDFIHSKSVSALSAHMENIYDDKFDMKISNESFPLSDTVKHIPLNSYNTYNSGTNTITNISSGNPFDPYSYQEILKQGNKYFVRVTVSVSSSDCIGISIYSSISDKKTQPDPTINTEYTIHTMIEGGENGKLCISHNYSNHIAGREMMIKEILIIEMTDSGIENLIEEFGISDAADKINWGKIVFKDEFPELLPANNYQTEKDVSITLFPLNREHAVSRRKKYIIENIATNKIGAKSTSNNLILHSFSGDTSDLLIYASVRVINNSSSNISVSMLAKSGTLTVGEQDPGWNDTKTILKNGGTAILSILVKEGWGKGLSNTRTITSIELSSASIFSYDETVISNLSSNGVEYWLDTMNFITNVSYPINKRVVNTLEKKVLWCDKFISFNKFTDDIVEYNMLSPHYTLISEAEKLTPITDNNSYYSYLDEMTEGDDGVVLENDIPNFSFIHSFGNSSNPFGSTSLKGVGVFANTIKEIKDV